MVITDTLSPLVQATFLKAHLKLVAVGMTPPRGVRKGDLLKKAGIITGKTYKRGQYMEAANDLRNFTDSFLEPKGADHG